MLSEHTAGGSERFSFVGGMSLFYRFRSLFYRFSCGCGTACVFCCIVFVWMWKRIVDCGMIQCRPVETDHVEGLTNSRVEVEVRNGFSRTFSFVLHVWDRSFVCTTATYCTFENQFGKRNSRDISDRMRKKKRKKREPQTRATQTATSVSGLVGLVLQYVWV